MDTSNPGPLLLLGGGVVIALGTILDWGPGVSGLNVDFNGLFGIVALLIGLALAAIGAIRAFAPDTKLPDEIAGYSLDQILFVDALTVFLWTFALISESGTKIGLHLTWIGGAVALAGTVLSMRNAPAGGPEAPTTF
jgi:hypothetical protein